VLLLATGRSIEPHDRPALHHPSGMTGPAAGPITRIG
jgi:hypothetical protein